MPSGLARQIGVTDQPKIMGEGLVPLVNFELISSTCNSIVKDFLRNDYSSCTSSCFGPG